MKPFNLDEAKAGKPVCTRDGRKARIICFDAKGIRDDAYIVALITGSDGFEQVLSYDSKGKFKYASDSEHDLMMFEEIDTLPKSWEEFHSLYGIDMGTTPDMHMTQERNRAIEAFKKLIVLRDVYRQGWEPYWEDTSIKQIIISISGGIIDHWANNLSSPLSFQSAEIRDKFLENFKDLIEQAKEFI